MSEARSTSRRSRMEACICGSSISSSVSAAFSSSRAAKTALRSSGLSSLTISAMSAGWSLASLVWAIRSLTELTSVFTGSTASQEISFCGQSSPRAAVRRRPSPSSPTRRASPRLPISTPMTSIAPSTWESCRSFTRTTRRPSMSTICLSRICRASQSSVSARLCGCKLAASIFKLSSLLSQLRTTDQSSERTFPLFFRMTPVTLGKGSVITTTRSRTRPTRCCRTSTTSALRKSLRKIKRLASELLEEQGCVVPAEAEGVRQRQLDVQLARPLRDVVEITLRVGVLQVDGRRRDAFLDGLHRDHRLNRSGGAQQMAQHRFGRADRDAVGGLAKDVLERQRFRHVAQLGRGPVGVDVTHVFGRDPRFGQRPLHRLGRSGAHRIRRRDVAGVGRRAVADDLGDDRSTPPPRRLELLEDQDSGPFPHDKAVALHVEGTAGPAGFDVAGRDGTRRAERRQRQRRDTGLG